MLASASDINVGGREIDAIMADYFCKDFQARFKCDARKNPRAYLRLLSEVEKLKKQMSANSTKLPINIECFMDEKDVRGEMQRSDMESLCSHLFKRVELTLKSCLNQSSMYTFSFYGPRQLKKSSRICFALVKRLTIVNNQL